MLKNIKFPKYALRKPSASVYGLFCGQSVNHLFYYTVRNHKRKKTTPSN